MLEDKAARQPMTLTYNPVFSITFPIIKQDQSRKQRYPCSENYGTCLEYLVTNFLSEKVALYQTRFQRNFPYISLLPRSVYN